MQFLEYESIEARSLFHQQVLGRFGNLGIRSWSQRYPRPEHLIFRLCTLQKPLQPIDHQLLEFIAVSQFWWPAIGPGCGTGHLQKIISGMGHCLSYGPLVDGVFVIGQLLLKFSKLFGEGVGLRPGRCCPNHRQFLRALATREDAVQSIVVIGADRFVLVVVAAGTGNRKPEQAPRHQIDSVINDVVGVAAKGPPHSQEAEGSKIFQRHWWLKPVGGKLQRDELVVGQILMQGPHYPVAIGPGIGILR